MSTSDRMRAANAITSRQADLLAWLRVDPAHQGLTVSGIHLAHYVYDRYSQRAACFDDLKRLADVGIVRREGQPARWYLT